MRLLADTTGNVRVAQLAHALGFNPSAVSHMT